ELNWQDLNVASYMNQPDRLRILGYNPQSAGGDRLSEMSEECGNFDFTSLAGTQQK
ncbi:unnamed protein product, partial [Prorocentrum cordatum]